MAANTTFNMTYVTRKVLQTASYYDTPYEPFFLFFFYILLCILYSPVHRFCCLSVHAGNQAATRVPWTKVSSVLSASIYPQRKSLGQIAVLFFFLYIPGGTFSFHLLVYSRPRKKRYVWGPQTAFRKKVRIGHCEDH